MKNDHEAILEDFHIYMYSGKEAISNWHDSVTATLKDGKLIVTCDEWNPSNSSEDATFSKRFDMNNTVKLAKLITKDGQSFAAALEDRFGHQTGFADLGVFCEQQGVDFKADGYYGY